MDSQLTLHSATENDEFLPKIAQEEQERYERIFAQMDNIAGEMPEEMTFYVVAALAKKGQEGLIIAAPNHYVSGTTISDVIYKHAEQSLFETAAILNLQAEAKFELYVTLEPCCKRESGGMPPCVHIIENSPIQISKIIVSRIDWRNRRVSGRGLQELAGDGFNLVLLESTNDSQSKIREINQQLSIEKRISMGLKSYPDEAETLTIRALQRIDNQIGRRLRIIDSILDEIKSIPEAEIFLERLEETKDKFKTILGTQKLISHVRGSPIEDTFDAEALNILNRTKTWAEVQKSLQNKLRNIARVAIGTSIRRQFALAVALKIQHGQYRPIISQTAFNGKVGGNNNGLL